MDEWGSVGGRVLAGDRPTDGPFDQPPAGFALLSLPRASEISAAATSNLWKLCRGLLFRFQILIFPIASETVVHDGVRV